MAYISNIPMATDFANQSQAQIQGNFGAIQALVSVNHVNFNAPNQGMHTTVQLPVNAAPPAGVAGIGQLYTQAVGVGNVSTLYWQGDANAATVLAGGPFDPTSGSTTLPNGLIIKWGLVTSGGSGYIAVTFGEQFTNGCLSALTTAVGGAGLSSSVTTVSDTGLTVVVSLNNAGISGVQAYYIAIGY